MPISAFGSEKVYSYGLTELAIIAIPSSGDWRDAVWGDFEQIAENLEGTVNLSADDVEVTDINVEEADDPILTLKKKGKSFIESDIPNLSARVAEILLGATIDEEVIDAVTYYVIGVPNEVVSIEYIVRAKTESGMYIFFNRADFACKQPNGVMGKTETINIHFMATALKPTVGTVKAVEWAYVKPGTSGYWLGATAPTDTIDALQAVSAGGLKLTVDGGTPQDVVNLDFSTDITIADILVTLNAGFDDGVWTFDGSTYKYKFTSATTTGSSTVLVEAPGSGDDISAAGITNLIAGAAVVGT